MSTELIPLALLMFAVTYPTRALPLLIPGIERLPGPALTYLRLVGPAVLVSLGVTNTLLVVRDGTRVLALGTDVVAVTAAVAIVIWRRNLLVGLIVAVVLGAVLRALPI